MPLPRNSFFSLEGLYYRANVGKENGSAGLIKNEKPQLLTGALSLLFHKDSNLN
jgi:hypothetical protein